MPPKVKNWIFSNNMEFSFTPYDLYQPTPDPFVNGPHEIMDGPKSLTTYGWPRQAKNCILDYNIVVCINIQCCCMKPPKIYEWPPCSLWRPQKFMDGPENFSLKIAYFFMYTHETAQIRVHSCSTFMEIIEPKHKFSSFTCISTHIWLKFSNFMIHYI